MKIAIFLGSLLLTFSCAKEESTSSPEKAPAKSAGSAENDASKLTVEIVGATEHAEFPGDVPIKAFSGKAFACVKYTLTSTKELLVVPRPKVKVASGKTMHQKQHASKAFGSSQHPTQAIDARLEAGAKTPFSLCYEVKVEDLDQPMSLDMPSGEAAEFTVTRASGE